MMSSSKVVTGFRAGNGLVLGMLAGRSKLCWATTTAFVGQYRPSSSSSTATTTTPSRVEGTPLPIDNSMPFASTLSKILNPGGWVRWSMQSADRGRASYYKCAQVHESLRHHLSLPKEEFQTWFSITLLHIWMLSTRLRAEGPLGRNARQEIYNHLWPDLEIRLHKEHGVRMKMNKICKQLMGQYYGQMLGYDEGLWAGDAELASAFWRNILPRQEPSAVKLEHLTIYVHTNLRHLESLSREDVLTGNFDFIRIQEVGGIPKEALNLAVESKSEEKAQETA